MINCHQHVWDRVRPTGLLASPVPPEETDDHLVIRPLPQSLSREVKQPSTNIFTFLVHVCLDQCSNKEKPLVLLSLEPMMDGHSRAQPTFSSII